MRVAVLLFSLALLAAVRSDSLQAQSDSTPSTVADTTAARAAEPYSSPTRTRITAGAGALVGSYLGMRAGAAAGEVVYRIGGPCHCEDPALGEQVVGLAVGTILGAAIGSTVGATLAGDEPRFGRRLRDAVVATGLGAAAMFAVHRVGGDERAVVVSFFGVQTLYATLSNGRW